MYPFRYCTVSEAKAYANLSVSDADILKRIELWGEVINQYTGKWFVPVYFNGNLQVFYDDMFCFPNKIPIIELSSPDTVTFSSMKGTRVIELPEDTLNIDGDTVELYDYIAVEGYFGWLNHRSSKVTTTVYGEVDVNGTTIKLIDRTGINKGDVLLINKVVSTIVTELCPEDAKMIKVDPIKEVIPTGAEVVDYGKIPTDINYAILEIMAKKGYGSEEQRNQEFIGRMISETTDNYAYTLTRPSDGYSFGTGVLEADKILSRYKEQMDIRLI